MDIGAYMLDSLLRMVLTTLFLSGSALCQGFFKKFVFPELCRSYCRSGRPESDCLFLVWTEGQNLLFPKKLRFYWYLCRMFGREVCRLVCSFSLNALWPWTIALIRFFDSLLFGTGLLQFTCVIGELCICS